MTQMNWGDKDVSDELMSQTPMRTWGDPTEVARGAVVLASEDVDWATGVAFNVDGGYLCV